MRDCSLVLNASLANYPLPRAVSVGGKLKASDDDSHGLGLEVGAKVSPHIGVKLVNGAIEVKVMYFTLAMGPGPVI